METEHKYLSRGLTSILGGYLIVTDLECKYQACYLLMKASRKDEG